MCTLQGGIRCYIKETTVRYPHLVQFICDRLCVAVLIEECISYQEGFFLVVYVLQLIESDRQTAFLEIYLFRDSEPKHVLSPFGNGFGVQQVLDTYVLRYRVAAVGTAAQGQGRSQLEVIEITDTSVGGWGVDQDTAGLHAVCVLRHLLCLGGMDIQGCSMSIAAVFD